MHAFDPTPRAVNYIEKIGNRLPNQLHFYPVGLWSEGTTLRFFFSGLNDGMFSAVDIKRTGQHVECPVKRLATLMRDLGHNHVDMAKIDMEGAEYDVIDNLVSEKAFPTVLCIEFDQPVPVRRTFRAVRLLTE